MISTGLWHKHGVDVYVPEKGKRCRHSRRNVYVPSGTHLTFVTSLDVPFNVLVKGRPPEAIEQTEADGKQTLVSGVVVGFVDECTISGQGNY